MKLNKEIEMCRQFKKGDCPYFEPNCIKNGNNFEDEFKSDLNCCCPKFMAFLDAKDENIVKEELDNMNITSKYKLEIMLQMQKVFAGRFHKVDDLTKLEMDKWTNAYLVCIEDEIAEASEFLDIYDTKIKEFDKKEFGKELIDILHFLMDGMIVCGMKYDDFIQSVISIKDINEMDMDNIDTLDLLVGIEAVSMERFSNKYTDLNQMFLVALNYIIRDIRMVRQEISWKHWKKPSNTMDLEKIYRAYSIMLLHLIDLFILNDMSSDDIYNTYVSKNIENIRRQKNGY